MKRSNKSVEREIKVGDAVFIKEGLTIWMPTDKNGVKQNVAYVELVGKDGVTVSFEANPGHFWFYTLASVVVLEGVKFIPSWKKVTN